MHQQELIPIDLDQAIDDLIRATGGYKSVAYQLWATKAPATAYARIKACLDTSQESTNFTAHELAWLIGRGRQAGYHGLANFLMESADYEAPTPAAQKSRKQELLERDAALAAERVSVATELAEIEKAETMDSIRQVKAVG